MTFFEKICSYFGIQTIERSSVTGNHEAEIPPYNIDHKLATIVDSAVALKDVCSELDIKIFKSFKENLESSIKKTNNVTAGYIIDQMIDVASGRLIQKFTSTDNKHFYETLINSCNKEAIYPNTLAKAFHLYEESMYDDDKSFQQNIIKSLSKKRPDYIQTFMLDSTFCLQKKNLFNDDRLSLGKHFGDLRCDLLNEQHLDNIVSPLATKENFGANDNAYDMLISTAKHLGTLRPDLLNKNHIDKILKATKEIDPYEYPVDTKLIVAGELFTLRPDLLDKDSLLLYTKSAQYNLTYIYKRLPFITHELYFQKVFSPYSTHIAKFLEKKPAKELPVENISALQSYNENMASYLLNHEYSCELTSCPDQFNENLRLLGVYGEEEQNRQRHRNTLKLL